MSDIHTVKDFMELLKTNPGMVLIKFSAVWCGPCKRVASNMKHGFARFANHTRVALFDIDIDESLELYAFLKSKRMVQGIPAVLMYRKGNHTFAFDDSVNTSKTADIDAFFERCQDVADKLV